MNLDRLNTFTIAAEVLNFTHAARRLQLSQPAISQQIRELEDELGVTLFERRGRSLVLTPAGERLRPMALSLIQDIRNIQEQMDEFHGMPQGTLQIGAGNTLGIYLLPYALGSFSQRHPGIRTSLRITETSGIVQGMQEGSLDLALVEEDLSSGAIHGWEKVPLLEDELVLIAPPHHPWAHRGQVSLEELEGVPFVLRQSSSAARKLTADCLAEVGFDPRRLSVRFELGNTEGIKRTVMAGLGVGFASRYAITDEVKNGMLVQVSLERLNIRRTLWLLRPSGKRLSLHQQLFVDLLLQKDWVPAALK